MPKQKREHQRRLERRATDIATGRTTDRRTLADVTPGGGKTGAGALFARTLLDAGVIDRVAWVCPRTSLTFQVASSFNDPDFNPTYHLRKADNTAPLVRDLALGARGYTTTYQSVYAQPDIHVDEFKRHRYLLVLDEPHHLADNERVAWGPAIAQIEELSTHTLLMTGTAERHDRRPLPFVDYSDKMPLVHVSYSRKDALSEKAIVPTDFIYIDGWAEYYHNGDAKRIDLSSASEEDVNKALKTALTSKDYVFHAINKCLLDWVTFRDKSYKSKAIVVVADQAMARISDRYIRSLGTRSVIAISDEDESQRNIRRFREGRYGDVLVTVGMAYEGLDVPSCTHLLCLTLYRSVPWLEQAFARASRVNYSCGIPYEQQWAFVYVPDDPSMRQVVERMRNEQKFGVREQEQGNKRSPINGQQESTFVPLGADATTVSYGNFDTDIDSHQSAIIDMVRNKYPSSRAIPPSEIAGILSFAGDFHPAPVVPKSDKQSFGLGDEQKLRRIIEQKTRNIDRSRTLESGTTNKALWKIFKKSREHMGVEELVKVLKFLEECYADTI